MLKLYLSFTDEDLPNVPVERLSFYRAEKLLRLKDQQARRLSLCAELLLRYAMLDCGFPVAEPLSIEKGEYGKPYLKTGECRFSLSHSGNAVLCAVGDRECGVDVQLIRPMNKALMERSYTQDERECVYAAEDKDEAFTAIWAKKESVAKASGRGLTVPFRSFSVLDAETAEHLWQNRICRYVMAAYGEEVYPDSITLIQVKASALQI